MGVLGLVQRVAVAALLTITEYGLWGLIVTALITLAWLKQIGIADKFVQQDEPDQEAAFQKAFTLELAYSAIFFAIACVAFPILGAIYGHMEIVVPGIVLASSLVISAAETPIWIAYRQMRFVRQRVLESIDPRGLGAAVTIVLAIAGLGYWSLVLGPVAGSICGGIAAVATSPYPLRLRYERGHAARVLLVLLAAARLERQRAGDRPGLGADRQLHRRPRRARRARAGDHLLDVRRPARLADPADDLPGGVRGQGSHRAAVRGVREVEPAGADVGVSVRGLAGPVRPRPDQLRARRALARGGGAAAGVRAHDRGPPGRLQLGDLLLGDRQHPAARGLELRPARRLRRASPRR